MFWLGQQHSPENSAFLRGLCAKLAGEELKEKVIFSLSQMGGADNGRWLMDIALNEREPVEMRKKALFWVGQTGGELGRVARADDRGRERDNQQEPDLEGSRPHR